MKTYISKPVEIKAELFNPDRIEEYRKIWAEIRKGILSVPWANDYFVKTLEGYVKITENDYLICWTKWEFYPCRKDIFEWKYVSKD